MKLSYPSRPAFLAGQRVHLVSPDSGERIPGEVASARITNVQFLPEGVDMRSRTRGTFRGRWVYQTDRTGSAWIRSEALRYRLKRDDIATFTFAEMITNPTVLLENDA